VFWLKDGCCVFLPVQLEEFDALDSIPIHVHVGEDFDAFVEHELLDVDSFCKLQSYPHGMMMSSSSEAMSSGVVSIGIVVDKGLILMWSSLEIRGGGEAIESSLDSIMR